VHISINIDGTEVTVQDKAPDQTAVADRAPRDSTTELPPALAEAVARGDLDGGRAPDPGSISGRSGSPTATRAGGDQPGGAAPDAVIAGAG
jgi:hypothetical protein